MKTVKGVFGGRQGEGGRSNTLALFAIAMCLAISAEAVAVLAVLGPRASAGTSVECCEKMSGSLYGGPMESDRAGVDLVGLFRAETIE
ncbi:hypothetical protein [Leisingera caerulea]|uniref:hypothetical protein n=1 Tax=Leisingera caerulea TaxID=506591 RepID=UPI000484ABD2|nr:hypothetical protein [Leisingera caerulea]